MKQFAEGVADKTVGIDARIETERGACLDELGDPHNRVNWLLSMAALDSTVCLRFIDPYGNALFNGLQIPVLENECAALGARLTEPILLEGKRAYLERAKAWPNVAFQEAQRDMETLSLNQLRDHLEALLRLFSDAIDKGPHHYVRFIGD